MLNPTRDKLIVFFTLFIFCIPFPSIADYKQPDEISDEDYEIMFTTSAEYNQCLLDKALAMIDKLNDPRHIADFAMKQCTQILQTLRSELESRNFPPTFIQGYARRISNRSARSLLGKLMTEMSNRAQKPE